MKLFVKLQSIERTKAEDESSAFGGAAKPLFRHLPPLQTMKILLVGFFEALKLFIATFDGQVQSFFGLLLATPNAFELFINDGSNLNKVTQTHAARFVGSFANHLSH
jgi:hypothetical protein